MLTTTINQIEELEIARDMFEDARNTAETAQKRIEYIQGIIRCREKIARLKFKLTKELEEQWKLSPADIPPADVYFEDGDNGRINHCDTDFNANY
jgi:hypothetical protein